MAESSSKSPNEAVSAKVRLALESAEKENFMLVAYLCEMALAELQLLDAEEYQKNAEKLSG